MGAEKDPMTPELRRLLDLEVRRSDPPDRLREQVRERLASELRLAGAEPRRLSLGARRLWAVIGAGALTAAAWEMTSRPSAPRVATESAPSPAPKAVVVPALAPEQPPIQPAAPVPAVVQAVRPPKESHRKDDSLARERGLIERARSQLRANHAGAALSILREHERAFPDGILVEERLGLQIQALAASGEIEPAARHAREFRMRFPQSPLLPAIDAAVRRPGRSLP